MKKATSALFVILLFVFSCTKESVSPETDPGEDFLKGAKLRSKTLKIHESSGTMGVVPSEACASGMQYLIQGTGHATHLGAFTVQNTVCIGTADPIQGVLTAANGDQIFTEVAYTFVDDRGLVYHYVILRGNGRFDGASGFIDMWGLIDYDENIFMLEGLGEIIY